MFAMWCTGTARRISSTPETRTILPIRRPAPGLRITTPECIISDGTWAPVRYAPDSPAWADATIRVEYFDAYDRSQVAFFTGVRLWRKDGHDDFWEPLPDVKLEEAAGDLVETWVKRFSDWRPPRLRGEPLERAADVASFLDEFDLHPNGPLFVGNPDHLSEHGALRELDPDTGPTEIGGTAYTSALVRLAVVDNRDTELSEVERAVAMREGFVEQPRDERLAAFGIHELTHLALRPRHIVLVAPNALSSTWGYAYSPWSPYQLTERPPLGKGGFFEEGLASLVEAIYVWRTHPEIAEQEEAEVREVGGLRYTIPLRYLYRNSHQMHAAHGVELLVGAIPELWPLLLGGPHRYGSVAAQAYSLLTCFDTRLAELFVVDDTHVSARHLSLVQAVLGV